MELQAGVRIEIEYEVVGKNWWFLGWEEVYEELGRRCEMPVDPVKLASYTLQCTCTVPADVMAVSLWYNN